MHTHTHTHTNPTHFNLDFLHHGVDVQHGTVASADDGLVLQDGDLGIEHLSHVAGVGGVTQDEARRDVLETERRSANIMHYIHTCSDINYQVDLCT